MIINSVYVFELDVLVYLLNKVLPMYLVRLAYVYFIIASFSLIFNGDLHTLLILLFYFYWPIIILLIFITSRVQDFILTQCLQHSSQQRFSRHSFEINFFVIFIVPAVKFLGLIVK